MFKLACVLTILLATLSLYTAEAQTKRPPIADALLNEPISLMDWGIMHVDRDIKSAVERLNKEIDDEVAADPRWRTMSSVEFNKEQNNSIKEYKKNHPEDQLLASYKWTHYYFNTVGLRQFNYQYTFGYATWSDDQERIRIGVAVKPFPRDREQNPASPDFDKGFRPKESFVTADACTDLLHDVKNGLLSAVPYASGDPILLILHWFGHRGGRLGGVETATSVQYPPALAPDQIAAITNLEVNISDFGFIEGSTAKPDIACSQALNGGPATIHDHRQKQ
jgi:hypothetical protein